MLSRALISIALCAAAVSCGGPVQERSPPSGELIAFGGGPGGALDACFTCHGLNGEGLNEAPRLAGLDAGYLMKQLFDYAHDLRADPIMAPVARRLSGSDMRTVSDYYARMEDVASPNSAPPAIFLAGDARRGLRACADCHGRDGLGLPPNNPAIAGQPAEYTREQLRRWKAGLRRNDPSGVMAAAARVLTEDEIEMMAQYLSNSPTS